ncbi:TonB-dependent receptor [Saccharospirillum sp.]|uniref:TonB-dependent receptor domain-containing protein n=1 Tax=Saccharospirillum sp. TaxID=2033801 RepID=UPI0034A05D27
MKTTPILAASLMLPLLAAAEDVVVTASRYQQPVTNTLAAVTVLTAEDIKRFGDQDLASLLNRVAGISQTPAGSLGSTSSLQIRGASTGQMIVLIDGVRAGSATTGSATLNAIPLSNIERIEVVRGPASSLYGADGIGGVIQIFTADPEATEGDVHVAAEYGSFNFQSYRAGFRATAGDTTASGRFGYLSTDGFDSTTLDGNGNEDRDGFKEWSGSLNVESRLTEALTLDVNHNQSHGVADFDDASCTSDCAANTHTTTVLMNSGVGLRFDGDDSWQVQGKLGRHLDESTTESSFPGEFNTERLTYSLSAQRPWGSRVSTIFGTDGYWDQVDSTTDYDESERHNQALFGQARFNYNDYELQTSLRVDDNSAYGTNLTGNVAASTFVTGDIETIISYGTAFKAPTFNDLYYPGFSNPDLVPEESQTLELAMRQFGEQGQWRLSVYQTRVENLIQSGNNLDSTLQGAEAEWSQQFGVYDLALNAAYLDARDDDGDRLENRPVWSGFVALGRQAGPVRLDLDVKAEGERVSGGEDLDGYITLGAGGRYSLGEASFLSARVDNLLDEDYVLNHDGWSDFDYNTPGRSFKVSAEYHF